MKTIMTVVLSAALAGCSASDAKPSQHTLEIGDPVLVRSSFNSVDQCEQFVNRLIVVLHKAGHEIPKPMRCN